MDVFYSFSSFPPSSSLLLLVSFLSLSLSLSLIPNFIFYLLSNQKTTNRFYGINLNQNVVLQQIGYDGSSGTPWERLFKVSTGGIIITALGFVPGAYWPLPPSSFSHTEKTDVYSVIKQDTTPRC